ncbi:MAG: lipoprotein signal peptidase [Bacteroidales bacterium]|nr:lipoprotein signal peptidase [Bacteroidales bacterium]
MKPANHKGLLALLIILAVIVADQALKIWVKTHFYFGEDYPITSWFHLKFIENNGMAFGMELTSKIILTMGRLAAVALLIWFISRVRRLPRVRTGFMVCIALITAGALGNIIDCVFYGEIFNNPLPPAVATLFPPDGGYSTWFEGRVVDMLYFPLFTVDIAGHSWEFFQYIFNIADSAICVGVFALILFYSRDFSRAWEGFIHRKKTPDPQ